MKKGISVILLLLVIQMFAGTVFFVKTNGNDSNDGKSWSSAFASFQKAYNSAVSGDQVWIAQGVYKPTYNFGLTIEEESRHFRLKNGVSFYGGFTGTEVLLSQRDYYLHRTILSGDLGIENDSTDNAYHVFFHPADVKLDNSAVLDGFVITGGTAKAGDGDHRMGSGMHNQYSSPTIRNCEFSENHSFGYLGGGGGMYNLYSDPIIENCLFSNNFAAHNGGGIFNSPGSPKITDCKFINNFCEFGTVFNNHEGNPELIRCEFYDNVAVAGGGAVFNKYCSAIIDRCIMIGNEARISAGGAIWNESAGCNALISNCLIADNKVYGSKGGFGGAVCNYDYCNPTITNCTIVNNSSTNCGGGIFTRKCTSTIINCIIRNNTAALAGNQIFVDDDASLNVKNTCYSDSLNDIRGNIIFTGCTTADPEFLSSGEEPYRLQNISPCIDSGNNGYVSSIYDLKDNIRIWDGDENSSDVVDMGCYEYIADGIDFEFNITGNVALEGQADNSGCEIIFNMKYPIDDYSVVAISDNSGNYSANIVMGIYDIKFRKPHYYTIIFEDVNCYSDSTLNNVNLLMKSLLSGSLSGTLPKNTYAVSGNIYVNAGYVLNIEAGTILEFDPGTAFIINGIVNANGNAIDSIRFVSLEEKTWEGLYFNSTADNSNLQYCIITGSATCGIYNSGADIILRYSRISGNISAGMGGAIVTKYDHSLFENCEIYDNGNIALYLYGSYSVFRNCTISKNDLGGAIITNCSSVFDNCLINSNSGYGIYNGINSNTLVVNSVISGNLTFGITAESSMRVKNSIISDNPTGFQNSSTSIPQDIGYSCFFNTSKNFVNCDSAYGTATVTNANGDSCDPWYNLILNPKFIDGTNGNFRFQADSPCVDAGSNTIIGYTFPANDIEGNIRLSDGNGDNSAIVDIGAFEFINYIPSGISVVYTAGSITISWAAVSGALSYKVYASADPFGTFMDISSQGTFSGASWSQAVSGTRKFYYVAAVTGKNKN